MKLEYTNGCICTSLTVDDVETIDMDINELKNILHKMIDNLDDISDLQSIFCDYLEAFGEYEDLGRCDECGDSICRFTLNI